MKTNDILVDTDSRGVATITLNRPERHNAFDDKLLTGLRQALAQVRDDRQVKVMVLAAAGRSFSAGADLGWMQCMAGYSEEENYRDALAMAEFFAELATLPKPTVAAVQGAAFGGGVGLVAACDMAVAAASARFALSEVKLGLIPAVISPYLERAIGARQLRRLALTGETFSASVAHELGLVQTVVEEGRLTDEVERLCTLLAANGPAAMAAVKERLGGWPRERLQELAGETARAIAELRVSAEGREGIAAFLEKRKPVWRES